MPHDGIDTTSEVKTCVIYGQRCASMEHWEIIVVKQIDTNILWRQTVQIKHISVNVLLNN